MEEGHGKILCCECGASIEPNAMNMCIACVRSRIDITEGITKQSKVCNTIIGICYQTSEAKQNKLAGALSRRELLLIYAFFRSSCYV